MPNHAPPMKMWGDRTHLYRSFEPRRLLFFVHGFGGQNTATWRNFSSLLVDDPDHKCDDLLFYGYESRRQFGFVSAGFLFQQCQDLLTRPEQFQTALDFPRRPDFEYESIVFVAHSLGAPVVRCMLLRARNEGARWLDKVALVFFAPATAGARAERIVRLVRRWRPGSILDLLGILTEWRWPVIWDLAEKSEFLTHIYTNTASLVTPTPHRNFSSKFTLFGTLENVIDLSKQDLAMDAPYTYSHGRDHVTVCKPEDATADPYRHFKNVVRAL